MILKQSMTSISGLNDELESLQTQISTEVTDRQTAISNLDAKIENVISNTDSEALDSLTEIVNAFQNADKDLNSAITDLASSKASKEELQAEVDRATAAEATKVSKEDNLSDLADVSEARTNLSVYSKTEVDTAINAAAIPTQENITVDGDNIVLKSAPRGGVILNFSTVRHLDEDNNVTYIPVVVDSNDDSGKTFVLQADSENQFDGKEVLVQYVI